jgi:hypothetical protein
MADAPMKGVALAKATATRGLEGAVSDQATEVPVREPGDAGPDQSGQDRA